MFTFPHSSAKWKYSYQGNKTYIIKCFHILSGINLLFWSLSYLMVFTICCDIITFISRFLLLNFIYFIGSGKLWRFIWSLTLVMIIFLNSLVLMQLSVSPHVNASIFVTCAATYFLSNDIFLDLIWFVGNGYATCIISGDITIKDHPLLKDLS